MACEAWWVLPATGAIWLAVFWRQFERHNYWCFYLGPAVALYAPQALQAMRSRLAMYNARWAGCVVYVVPAAIMVLAFRGTDDYYSRISCPGEAVAVWDLVNRNTRPDDRILLHDDPVLTEVRGGYRFRNLVPPQLAFYMDRPFDVEQNVSEVRRMAPTHAVYVVTPKTAGEEAAVLQELQGRYTGVQLGGYKVFDLRSGRGEGTDGSPG